MPAFSQLFEDPMAAIGYGLLTSGQNPVGAAMGVMQQAETNKAAREQAEFQKLMMQYKMQQAQMPKYSIANDAEGNIVAVDKRTLMGTPVQIGGQPSMMPQMPTQQAAPVTGGIQTRNIPAPTQYDMDRGTLPPPPAAGDVSLNDYFQRERAANPSAPPVPPGLQQPQLPAQIPDKPLRPDVTGRPKLGVKLGEADIDIYKKSQEPLPANIAKRQDEILEEIDLASSLSADLDSLNQTIQSGTVDLSLGKNIVYEAQNRLGKSDAASLAYNDIKRTANRIRNDTLRLNKGTQTEGDAIRATQELLDNLNDKKIVAKVMADISSLNQRAAKQKQDRLNRLLGEYKKPPIDFSSYQVQPAISQPSSGDLTPEEEQELMQLRQKYKGGNNGGR